MIAIYAWFQVNYLILQAGSGQNRGLGTRLYRSEEVGMVQYADV